MLQRRPLESVDYCGDSRCFIILTGHEPNESSLDCVSLGCVGPMRSRHTPAWHGQRQLGVVDLDVDVAT